MLTLFHTADSNVATFENLFHEIAPEIPVNHIVDEAVLRDARKQGITPEIQQRVTDQILRATNNGADVVLCTCSSLGNCAENTQSLTTQVIQRVDRAMAEKAVATGRKIIVVAAMASAIQPTKELVLNVAQKMRREVEIIEVLCEEAWPKFEAGDREGYTTAIAEKLREAATEGDVIVLAQASMAGAADLCADLPTPVLSSPRLGVEAAVSAYRALSR